VKRGTRAVRRASEPRTPLPAGRRAPDFVLPAVPEPPTGLGALRGRPVILVFYPADWSPVCGDQLALYNEVLDEFARYRAGLLAISVDGLWCHRAFASARKLRFPLLSDFEPKGRLARRYGVFRRRDGVAERALFVLDGLGVIRWREVSPPAVNPGADGILRALAGLGGERG